MVGITQDLLLRRREPHRRGPRGAVSTAAEALLLQLRGLDVGLPAPDRAFLRDLIDRLRRRDLPVAMGPSLEEALARRGLRLEAAELPTLSRLEDIDPAARAWAAAYPDLLPPELRVDGGARDHARATALAATGLAERADEDPLHAFLGGLLHDIGRPFLRGLTAMAPADRRPRSSTIAQLEEGLHPGVGAVLVEHWGLPPEIQLAIEHHHQPGPAVPSAVRGLVQVVRAADLFAHLLLEPTPPANAGALARELERGLDKLSLEPDIHLLETLASEVNAWRSLDTSDLPGSV